MWKGPETLETPVCVGAVCDLIKLGCKRVRCAVPGTMPGIKLMLDQELLTDWMPGDESEEVGRAKIISGKLRKLLFIQKARLSFINDLTWRYLGLRKFTLAALWEWTRMEPTLSWREQLRSCVFYQKGNVD